MRILVVGSGGREHALCWAISRSPLCAALHAAPGNAGMAEIAVCHPVAATDLDGLERLARELAIDFVVVGPEAALVAGIVDRLEATGIQCFGPSAAAAALEGSKSFTKELCDRQAIPTAAWVRVTSIPEAEAAIRRLGAPIVVKADGLAAGKGVVVAESEAEALAAVHEMMGERRFGAAGATIVLEEKLIGEEVSFFALADGTDAVPLGSAQDHKRVGDGDTGPNTGGMGAYSPAPIFGPEEEADVMSRIVRPALAGMAASGTPFRGILFAGLMMTASGPKLIEFNARFGDPECEVLLRRLKSDLLEALLAARAGRLDRIHLDWDERAALGVVMAAEGYPGEPLKGTEIAGLPEAATAAPETIVFHAGTRRDGERLLADGGRVLVVTSLGVELREARNRAYTAVDAIRWPEGFCRRDIGWRALRR